MEEAPFNRAPGLTVYLDKATYPGSVQLTVTGGAASRSIPFI